MLCYITLFVTKRLSVTLYAFAFFNIEPDNVSLLCGISTSVTKLLLVAHVSNTRIGQNISVVICVFLRICHVPTYHIRVFKSMQYS